MLPLLRKAVYHCECSHLLVLTVSISITNLCSSRLTNCLYILYSFHVQSHLRKGMKNARKYDPVDPVECLTLHLKTVVLQNYWGNKPDVDFAKFFILNAMVLEQMIFRTLNSCNDKWMSDQHRRLQVDNRASPDARFEFKRCHNDSWCCFPDSKHIHDLSVSNPFADRFENNFF